jgi:hypothetical protein
LQVWNSMCVGKTGMLTFHVEQAIEEVQNAAAEREYRSLLKYGRRADPAFSREEWQQSLPLKGDRKTWVR